MRLLLTVLLAITCYLGVPPMGMANPIPKAFQELGRSLSGERAERSQTYVSTRNPEKRRPQLLKGEGYIKGFRVSDNAAYSRFVLDMEYKPEYKVFSLDNPSRVVIDLEGAEWKGTFSPPAVTQRIRSVRYAEQSDKTLRIVLDTLFPAKVKNHFILGPSKEGRYRLVVDVVEKEIKKQMLVPVPVTRDGTVPTAPLPVMKAPTPYIIMIDAGHGGHDPGSSGRRGTREKDITLAYARALASELYDKESYKVFLTRDRDRYIPLRGRINIAREKHADLFISLHADSHPNPRVQGVSVYTLSNSASDKEAAALAQKENRSDVIAGVDLWNENDEVTNVIIDMVQRGTMNASAGFAEALVWGIQNETRVLPNPHRFAGFRVLTAADVPSVLIELGYLSNREEEKYLNSSKYKKRLVKAIVQAIDNYYERHHATF